MPTESSYNDIGQLLRRAREERHLALEYVAQALHIRVRYLDALESGRLNELPGLSYTKGYLQVYAAYIGLDKDEILRRFEDVEEQLGRHGFYFPQVFRKEKAPGQGAIWGGIAAAALVYCFWLAAHPARLSVSLVEPFPEGKTEIPTVLMHDGACFSAGPVLYPPCTIVRHPWPSLVSLQARTNMMMAPASQQTVEK